MNLKRAVGLGLAVLVATTVIGVGSASATTLCKENANPCPVGQRYPEKETILGGLEAGTTMKYEAISKGGFVLFSGACSEASISWSTIKNLGPGKFLTGTVTVMLFGKCESTPEACEAVTAENLAYNAELLPLGGGNGRVFLSNGAGGARKIKFSVCGAFGQTCTYVPEELPFNLTGVNGLTPAWIGLVWDIKAEGANPLCGEKILVRGNYTVAAPKPLAVSKEP